MRGPGAKEESREYNGEVSNKRLGGEISGKKEGWVSF